MAYFNHAFQKVFVGTTLNGGGGYNPDNLNGKLGTPGNILKGGEFAFVDAKTWYIKERGDAPGGCCPLVLAAGSIYQRDKIGPFHGGYQESNKSKVINPKYVSKFYRVDPCLPQNEVVHLGNTAFSDDSAIDLSIDAAGSGLTEGTYTNVELCGAGSSNAFATVIVGVDGFVTDVILTDGGAGYSDGNQVSPCSDIPGGGEQPLFGVTAGPEASCCKRFYCGETYTLRVDVKGSPALRLLNHNSYIIASAYGGCCPEGSIAPVEVDSTLIFRQWADAIVRYPVISPFLLPILIDQNGTPWYAPGTDAQFLADEGVDTWNNYTSPGYIDGKCAGLVLVGAYVDTKFENCTFQLTDFYEVEPVRIYASEVDLNGDPCLFDGVCVIKECEGRQAMGLGESVARDVILSEQYRQNFFHSDFRIREITQGYSVFDYINRNNLYTRYYLLHNVPRFNNPTSTFDNDQYLLEIITDGEIPEFQDFVNKWLENCGSQCETLIEESCVQEPCCAIYPYPGQDCGAPAVPA
jgi:hypothetical protein